MGTVSLRQEIYRRQQQNDAAKKVNVNDAAEMDSLILQITQKVTSTYGDLVSEVSRGVKPVQVLENVVETVVINEGITLEEGCTTEDTVKQVMNSILGYGVLQPLINDPEVTDIFVNGPKKVYKRVNQEDIPVPEISWRDDDHLEQYIRSVMIKCGRKIHNGIPVADGRDLRRRLRINAGIYPVAKTPYLAIRKHAVQAFTLDQLLRSGTFTKEVLNFLQKAVEARLNILLAGPTGSGKTTLLNVLASNFIPKTQRIVVIEEEAELNIDSDNIVYLEAKKKSGEDDTTLEMDDLVKNALRMAMRRIILGELRGREAFTLLRAFGTGHDGGLTTIHSNDIWNTLEQLAVMMLYANQPLSYQHLKRIISQSIDLIVYIENYRVVEIASVDGFDEQAGEVILTPVFATERNEEGKLECRFQIVSEPLRKLFWQRGVRLNADGTFDN